MGAGRQNKRSCPFCQHGDREELEQSIIDGVADARMMDKDMGWRANTAERHMRNHVGDYHVGANHSCAVCTDDDRRMLEVAYFEGERTTEDNAGQEINILRENVQSLNGKLSQFMQESSVHDDGVIGDMVRLHKEVRETLKDLSMYQEKWAEPTTNVANNTINVLKVELGKESPDVWKRVKASLMASGGGDVDADILEML